MSTHIETHMIPYQKNILGIGTWNDESYIMISPGGPGQPYRRAELRRYHLRWNIADLAAYQPVFDAFKHDRHPQIAGHLRAMKTNASDAGSMARDAELDVLASLVENAGQSDWTIILCEDKNAQGQVTYYIEVYRPH